MGAGKNGKGRVSPSKRQNSYSCIVCNCHKMYVQVGTDSERPGGYSLILKSYTYVPPQRVWFLPRAGVYINAKFAINSHCSYKKNLAVKSLCIFYKPRI